MEKSSVPGSLLLGAEVSILFEDTEGPYWQTRASTLASVLAVHWFTLSYSQGSGGGVVLPVLIFSRFMYLSFRPNVPWW